MIDRPIRVRVTRFDIEVDYRELVPENRIPIGFWRCLAEAVFLCRMSRIDPFRRCCLVDLFRVCRRRPAADQLAVSSDGDCAIDMTSGSSSVERHPAEQTVQADSAQLPQPAQEGRQSLDEIIEFAMDNGCQHRAGKSRWEKSLTAEKTTWMNVCRLLGLVMILIVAIPAPFCLRLAVYYVFEHDEVSQFWNFIVLTLTAFNGKCRSTTQKKPLGYSLTMTLRI